MPSSLRQSVAPVYLLLCLVLGGSAQGIWTNTLLQLAGVAIIAWAAAAPADEPLLQPAKQLLSIILIGLAVVAFQLVPLPASLWPHLGGRAEVANGYQLLGRPTPALPLSLAPYASLATLLTLIPPLAMLCAIVRLKAYRASWLALALLAGTVAGILLGALQVASLEPESSTWYLYPYSSWGSATGFFANANHMAILLVISLPFLAALLASVRRANMQRYSAAVALVAGAALVVLVGLALNRSIAGYALAPPVLVASALIVVPSRSRAGRWIAVAAGVLLVGALIALASSPIGERSLGTRMSVESRAEVAATTARAAGDFMPFGSGLGTFRAIYHLYENHDSIDTTTIPHAHNDYAELALETGIPGVVVLVLFLAWWAASVSRVWRFGEFGPYARAASVASAAILGHSLVDFPLRTAAISACFAMCLALLAERRAPRAAEPSELWPTRHVVLR
ncbi:MAG: O-antigen ligase family protein [Sphingomicrobium sp.]